LNAEDTERFVEESFKTLQGVLRYFNDRDIEPMSKITEIVRKQLEDFRPKVPLMVALRKEGMKDRHWEQISKEVGFKVQPTGDDFCF
jgi:dynein heavy chain, axonemal